MAKKKGFMSRLIEGPERSENYARSKLPSNRWQLGWDIFKTNFTRIIIINLIMLVFALPLIAILFFRSFYVSLAAQNVPFDSFMSYPFIGSLSGDAEMLQIGSHLYVTSFLPLAMIILAVGLSGVLYILRNMVWTEGVFVGSDFWRGVKRNFFVVAGTLLLYSVLLYAGLISIAFANYLIATGQNVVLFTITKVVTWIVLGFITIMMLHMLTMSVTYKLSFFSLIKNAFILTLALLPFNLFFAMLAGITILLYMIIPMLGLIVIILFGFSGGLLVWTVYSHWIYDTYINDKVPGAKRNRGIYTKPDKPSFGDDLAEFAPESFDTVYLNKRPVKPITDYDVEIAELPETYGRADLARLAESKEAMRRDSDKYVEDVLSGKITQSENLSDHDGADAAGDTDNNDGDAPDGDTAGGEE